MRLATLAALRVRTITTQRLKWMTANPCGKWTWWADKNCLGDSKRPGDWLQLMLEDDGSLSVTIYQSYAPESLFYQIVGYTKHHGHKLELD